MLENKSIIHLLFLFLFFVDSTAQSEYSTDQYFCKVVNAVSNTPVFYATVKLNGTNIGVIADDKGEFRLPLELFSSDSVIISSIGYRNKRQDINTLKKGQLNVIKLSPSVEALDEVIVVSKKGQPTKLNAKQIIKFALKNIPSNYPNEPFSYIGYYRDYQQPIDSIYAILSNQKKDIEYINLNEGIVEVFDAGFNTDQLSDDQNQTVVYSYHDNKNFWRDSMLSIPYDNYKNKYLKNVIIPPLGGNELNLLQLTNAIRNHDKSSFSFVEVLKKNFLRNHKFKLKGINFLDDVPIYEIGISAKVDRVGMFYYARGTIFISKKNYAIHKLNYSVYNSSEKELLYTVAIEYAPFKGKMYLNYITFNNRFQVNSNQYFKVQKATFDMKDVAFTVYFDKKLNIDFKNDYRNTIKVKYKKRRIKIQRVAIFSDHIKVFLDKSKLLSIKGFNTNTLLEDFELSIKGIKDVFGNQIGKMPKLFINQYREIFVQEVFPGKKIPLGKKPMDKSLPLSKSSKNSFEEGNKYWENTPLKQNKISN
ncbi:carboxypeptidase-like regulatory domain-containing protein [Aquimarina gracilis]|uniref:Carboxypeptidase-like regulatory domain-containing protein n=1 Tax=Aquimarina gracilis TaxID=874422 RepID=A0ABU5ZRS9_9FLAO|nr:carboxypeptidase-like regulatory domain-containing protein [Aquimarina gracilis]MEB3344496.1 carboxypeptidase-like regulatory domain-containing protein [Aquimarina gracilis]